DGGRKVAPDRDEGERDQSAAAKPAHQSADEQPGHGRRENRGDATQYEQEGGGDHVRAHRPISRKPAGGGSGDDRAGFVNGESPAGIFDAAEVAEDRKSTRLN